jgi:hypothetical protein
MTFSVEEKHKKQLGEYLCVSLLQDRHFFNIILVFKKKP